MAPGAESGGAPPPQEHAITSDEILVLDELPQRAVVVGAGYIALEFAGILQGMGVETHVMFRADRPLRGCAHGSPKPYRMLCSEKVRRFYRSQGSVAAREQTARALWASDE